MSLSGGPILGVNGCRLAGARLGVGRYIEYLLRSWARDPAPFRAVRVYTPAGVHLPRDTAGAVEQRVLPWRGPAGLWEQVALPLGKPPDDVFFCPAYTVPLLARARPLAVTHHGSYEALRGEFPLLRRWKARLAYQLACRRADRIITVSESSKRDIVRFYGVDPDRIRVIPDGVDERFRPRDDAALIERRRRSYFADGRPYLLFVGKLSRRRHLPELVEAFARLRGRRRLPHGLVLIGPDTAGQRPLRLAARHRVEEHVVHKVHASHGELAEAYNACDLLVYPSEREGFGLPVLEAMASGTPVVALDRPAISEFASGVALLAPDGSAASLEAAMETALDSDELRRRMRRDGPLRAARYGWAGIARRTLEVLAELA